MSDSFIGEIRMFAGLSAPVNWAFCNGQLLLISEYQSLYDLIGNQYGGDGKTNFALPDLQGSVVIGTGQGSGLPNYALGDIGGSDLVTLTAAQLPTHTHALSVSSQQASSSTPNSTMLLGSVANTLHLYTDTSQGANGSRDFSANAIGMTGNNQDHENIMPSLVVNYIISLKGIAPMTA